MRRRGSGILLGALGLLAACDGKSLGDGDRRQGATGGALAGNAGQGTSGAGGQSTAGSAGSSGSGGASSGNGSGATTGSGGGSGAGAGGRNEGGRAGEPGGAAGKGGTSGEGGSSGGQAAGGVTGEGGVPGDAGTGGASSAGTSGAGTSGAGGGPVMGLSWPVDCIPNDTCVSLGYPDFDGDGDAFDCSDPGHVGHQGTDIGITSDAQEAGTAVRAAADGVVLFAFDGKFDQCPNANEPDCQPPPGDEPGSTIGTNVCTELGPYCGVGEGSCFWCFSGGNVIVVRHEGVPGVFATRYDHLRRDSVLVEPGDAVTRGQKIAEAASAGASTAPHLHFEVWGTGFYELADPWAGPCGPNTGPSLWAYDPPWVD